MKLLPQSAKIPNKRRRCYAFLTVFISLAFSLCEVSETSHLAEPDGQPSFAELLPNITLHAGSTLIISCVVDNLGTYEVTWMHADGNTHLNLDKWLIAGNPRINVTLINGTTSILRVSDIQRVDAGKYICQINTSPMKFQVASVEVTETSSLAETDEEPTFAELLPNITLHTGSTLILHCFVNNLGTYRAHWIHIGKQHLDFRRSLRSWDPRINMTLDNGTTSILRISDIQSEHGGKYICRINTSPMKSQEAFVEVIDGPSLVETDGEPVIVEPLPNIMLRAGSTLIIPCVVDNLGNDTVTWIHEDGNTHLNLDKWLISGNPRINVTLINGTTSILHISDIRMEDAGKYKCQTNTSPMKSQVAFVEITAPPFLWIRTRTVRASVGSDVYLKCNLVSNPLSLTYWTKEDRVLLQKSQLEGISNEKYGSNTTTSGPYQAQMILKINSLVPEDFGSYTCVAENALGNSSGEIIIIHDVHSGAYGKLPELTMTILLLLISVWSCAAFS